MSNVQHWEKVAADFLVGKTIRAVRYMTVDEAKAMYWESQPLVIEFTDGTYIFPQADDEGNDAGALAGGSYKDKKVQPLFPVMRE